MKENYNPQPVILKEKDLSNELVSILDNLSKNVHETWAAGRLMEGWTHGKHLNGDKLEHPSLISYESLSEEEKEYDRRTVIATLSYLIENGYEIRKKE